MTKSTFLAGIAILATAAATAFAQPRRAAPAAPAAPASGPATYWMSADTTSGMGAMGAGAEQSAARRPSIMGAITGRGPSAPGAGPGYVRTLTLNLGSPRAPTGAPSAEHLPPDGLGAGPSLPLLTPPRANAPEAPRSYDPRSMPSPQGRILIYWGCGERARPGQPLEIDLSRMAQGQVPPIMAQMGQLAMQPPHAYNSRTYGEWPNERMRTPVPATGSLVGAHSVRSNYSPEINFTLAPGQDFLAPVRVTSNQAGPSGAVPVSWQSVPNARAWMMTSFGSAGDNTMVLWTSSEAQFAWFGMLDYLAEGDIARLLQQRVLLPATATQCTVPAEFVSRVQGASLMLNAFGPEANFSHPARPARAPRGWQPDWNVKLRTRSSYMGMLGMDMEAMMRGENPGQREQPRRRRSIRDRILGN